MPNFTVSPLIKTREELLATDEEVRYLHDRWRLLPGDDRAVSFVLEELLDARADVAPELS